MVFRQTRERFVNALRENQSQTAWLSVTYDDQAICMFNKLLSKLIRRMDAKA